MPATVLLRLRPAEPSGPPPFLGPHAAAWFTGRCRELLPDLPLEHSNGAPGFALGFLPTQEGAVSASLTLRVAALDDRLAEHLATLLPAPGDSLDLADARYLVDAVARTPVEHPLAGHVPWDLLAAPLFASSDLPDLARRPAFQLLTPTLFEMPDPESPDRALRPALPIPLPELVFGSLLDRWNAFAPTVLPAEVRDYAESCLAVQEARIQTRWERVGATRRTGCTGRVRFVVTRTDPFWQAPLAVLASFAPLAGIGSWTSQGFGQAAIDR